MWFYCWSLFLYLLVVEVVMRNIPMVRLMIISMRFIQIVNDDDDGR